MAAKPREIDRSRETLPWAKNRMVFAHIRPYLYDKWEIKKDDFSSEKDWGHIRGYSADVGVWRRCDGQRRSLACPDPNLPQRSGRAMMLRRNRSQGKPRAAVATSSGPITVNQRVSDNVLRQFLAKFLPKYPGVGSVNVGVDDGVVLLHGRVTDDDSRDEITDVVKRVEGVRVVLNQMNTDEELMTAVEVAGSELKTLRSYFARKWLLILLALGIVATLAIVARSSLPTPRSCWPRSSGTSC